MKNKKITVCLPVFNAENYINSALDTIFFQEKFNNKLIHVLIYNDGSTDRTLLFIKKWILKNGFSSQIQIINCNVNKGVWNANYILIKNVKTKWFTFLDVDDKFSKDAFFNFFKNCDENTNMVMSQTCAKYLPSNKTFINYQIFYSEKTKSFFKRKHTGLWGILFNINTFNVELLNFLSKPIYANNAADVFTLAGIFLSNPKEIKLCKKKIYTHYIINTSAGHTYSLKYINSSLDLIKHFLNFYADKYKLHKLNKYIMDRTIERNFKNDVINIIGKIKN